MADLGSERMKKSRLYLLRLLWIFNETIFSLLEYYIKTIICVALIIHCVQYFLCSIQPSLSHMRINTWYKTKKPNLRQFRLELFQKHKNQFCSMNFNCLKWWYNFIILCSCWLKHQGPRQYGCHGCLGTHRNLPTVAWHPCGEQQRIVQTQFCQTLA